MSLLNCIKGVEKKIGVPLELGTKPVGMTTKTPWWPYTRASKLYFVTVILNRFLIYFSIIREGKEIDQIIKV